VENGQQKQFEMTITIKQDWTKLLVSAETSQSTSRSRIGAVTVGDGGNRV